MMTSCPQCKRNLNVPDAAAGQQGRCPACQAIFTINPAAAPVQAVVQQPQPQPQYQPQAAPMATATAQPQAQPQGFAAGVGYSQAPVVPQMAMATMAGPKAPLPPMESMSMILKIVGLVGALAIVVSFMVPWWSADMNYTAPKGAAAPNRGAYGDFNAGLGEESQKVQKDFKEFTDATEKDEKFYRDVQDEDDRKETAKAMDKFPFESASFSFSAFGWDVSRGIVSFIFGLVALLSLAAVLVLQFFLPFARRWGWTLEGFCVLLGLTVAILGLTAWLGLPGKDFAGTYIKFSQGISAGPIMALAGGLLMVGGAGLSGLAGLQNMLRSRKAA